MSVNRLHEFTETTEYSAMIDSFSRYKLKNEDPLAETADEKFFMLDDAEQAMFCAIYKRHKRDLDPDDIFRDLASGGYMCFKCCNESELGERVWGDLWIGAKFALTEDVYVSIKAFIDFEKTADYFKRSVKGQWIKYKGSYYYVWNEFSYS